MMFPADSDVIDAKKLLDIGRLIDLRPHTRFAHFPEHSHNYVEVVYMVQGTTTHIANGKTIVDSLRGDNANCRYFQVADVPVIQNLMENLIWTLTGETIPNRRSICQTTMGLLFMELLNHTDRMASQSSEEAATLVLADSPENPFQDDRHWKVARITTLSLLSHLYQFFYLRSSQSAVFIGVRMF